jgi:uncharacterized tellurite resistance protein B-like protein
MSIASLSNILKIFQGAAPSDEERQHAFKEALLMTLARATDADEHVSPVEVESVQDIVMRITGEDVSIADVRVAAASKLYESAPLKTYLARAGRALTPQQRVLIVESLAEVIKSDVQVTEREIQFFNSIAEALSITPAELAGLHG